jgi:hypothetical protein
MIAFFFTLSITRIIIYRARLFTDNALPPQSFLLIQLLLSFTPLLLFGSFAVATILFSFISALLFSLFWIGAALLVLVPILFVTVSLGIGLWVWAVGSFLLARWVYGMVPLSVKGGMEVAMPNGKTVVVNKSGDGYGDVEAKVKPGVPQREFGTTEYN